MTRLALVDSGVANLASMERALRACGLEPERTRDPHLVADADFVVLPGVGSYAAGLAALDTAGLRPVLRRRYEADRPLLAVCLGMQMLGVSSEEAPEAEGLGIFPGSFRALPAESGLPHLGWSAVTAAPGAAPAVGAGFAAYANTYALREGPHGWAASWSRHGVPFVAALSRGRTLATQFHPELSGPWGLDLIERWLSGRASESVSGPPPGPGLRRRIVPCLDVKDGRIVKGVRFQALRDAGEPAIQARAYAAQGADELVLLDVGASPEGRPHQVSTVRSVREALDIPLTVGGGVSTCEDARRLLAAGADRVSVNSAGLARPALLGELASQFGRQCVLIAIDAQRAGTSWTALSAGGRADSGRDAVDWALEAVERGAGEVLLTSWDRDGTRSGCDLELIQRIARAVSVPIIASGGVGSRADVKAAFDAGACAVLAASIFHDNDDSVHGVKSYLAAKGVEVRQ